jgi:hypothetical protein
MRNDRLDTRWLELVKLTEEQFLEHRQHPGGGVFIADRERLKLSGIMKDGSYYSVTLTEEQVLNGDLPRIAMEYYQAYHAESEEP